MYIKREIEEKIIKYLNKPEIIALIGPRQAGKTTLLKNIYKNLKNAVYISFEDQEVLNLFNQNIKEFYLLYLKNKKYVFIDEFQYAKEGGKNLKYIFDTYKIKIIISGSSALDLTHQAVKYLVGRIFVFSLYTFSFSEFLLAKDKDLYSNIFFPVRNLLRKIIYSKNKNLPKIAPEILNTLLKYYKEYSIFGGYPRVVTTNNHEEKKDILKNIVNIYLLREIREILKLETDLELNQLIKLLALQISGTISYNELSNSINLDYKKLLKHLQILEKTYIIQTVLPFYKNKRIEITKTPKVYFYDIGFRNAIINNFQNYNERIDKGDINENIAASSFLNQELKFHYWRTKSNAEIDFIVEKNGTINAFEVKTSADKNTKNRSFYSFREKYLPQKTVILSTNFYLDRIYNNILYLPIYFI